MGEGTLKSGVHNEVHKVRRVPEEAASWAVGKLVPYGLGEYPQGCVEHEGNHHWYAP